MEFNNVVAYCKGFYKTREGDVPEMWKDIAHCIICDGYTVFSKNDVVTYCINYLDKFAKEFPKDAWKVSFGNFYRLIEHNKNIVNISKRYKAVSNNIDDYDLIIWSFRDFIRYNTDDSMFAKGIIPNEKVLPIISINDGLSEALWKKIIDKYEEQDTTKWYFSTYDDREKSLEKII